MRNVTKWQSLSLAEHTHRINPVMESPLLKNPVQNVKMIGLLKRMLCSVHQNHQTRRIFPMDKSNCLMRDFTNLNRIYKAHRTNIWWTLKVFRLQWLWMNGISQDLSLGISHIAPGFWVLPRAAMWAVFWHYLSGLICPKDSTYLPLDKVATISQRAFSNAFCMSILISLKFVPIGYNWQ